MALLPRSSSLCHWHGRGGTAATARRGAGWAALNACRLRAQPGAAQETGFQPLLPLSVVFVKLFGYFLDDDAEFSDNTADDERFAIRHEVHALSLSYVQTRPLNLGQ